MLFVHITSRIPGEKYGDLLQQKGGQGFPHLVFMDAEGEVVAVQEARTVEAFKATADKAQAYLTLRAVKDPTPAQKLDLFMAELEMGKLDLAAARKRKGELKDLTPEQEARIAAGLTDLEVMDALTSANPTSQEEANKMKAELGARFAAMLKAGRKPASEQASEPFYMLIMELAESQKDAAGFEAAMNGMREKFGKYPQAEKFFKAQEERLARLKSK